MSKKQVDWENVEADYRTGRFSNRVLAVKYGCTEGAIRKKAKAEGWEKDLTAKVQAATKAKLAQRVSEVKVKQDGTQSTHDESVRGSETRTVRTERQIIEEAAEESAGVVMRHRRTILSAQVMASTLLGQLEEAAAKREEIEEDICEETRGEMTSHRRSRMLRAVSLPTHTGAMLNLANALHKLVTAERAAWNLDDKAAGPSYEDELARLAESEPDSKPETE